MAAAMEVEMFPNGLEIGRRGSLDLQNIRGFQLSIVLSGTSSSREKHVETMAITGNSSITGVSGSTKGASSLHKSYEKHMEAGKCTANASSGKKNKEKSTAATPTQKVRKRRCKLIKSDFEQMVLYIEHPDNFTKLTGAGRKTKVGGMTTSKAKEFAIMAAVLSRQNGFPQCTGDEMRKRFDRYVASYKKAREWMNSTGAGLTDKELASGMTVEDKLNHMCPFFERMHAIHGRTANIDPPAEKSIGLGGITGEGSDTEGLEDDEADPGKEMLPQSEGEGDGIKAVEEFVEGAKEFVDAVTQAGNTEEVESFAEGTGQEDGYIPESFTDGLFSNPVELDDDEMETEILTGEDQVSVSKNKISESGSEKTPSKNKARNVGKSTKAATKKGLTPKDSVSYSLPHIAQQSQVSTSSKAMSSIVNLYEESIKQKAEYRKSMIEYRYAMLEDKRKAREEVREEESKKQKSTICLEMFKAGAKLPEIQEFLDFIGRV
ncbi:hypothetical protein R1sor_010304 [Riccia sorocarpa]|uniref:Uncharacterized protein n=1 Tax=Riccia sorocarpa TaxID=122646 RepID=A0ABD3HXL5_9MARC